MVCDEVKVFAAFQVVQIAVMWMIFGRETMMKTVKATAVLAFLGWVVLLYFLCQRNYRRFTWWFVAISVGFNIIYDIALIVSPTFRTAIKNTLDKAH